MFETVVSDSMCWRGALNHVLEVVAPDSMILRQHVLGITGWRWCTEAIWVPVHGAGATWYISMIRTSEFPAGLRMFSGITTAGAITALRHMLKSLGWRSTNYIALMICAVVML